MIIWDECDSIKTVIHRFLIEDPETRDSDFLLIALVWEKDVKKHGDKKLMELVRHGMITNPETIRRTRQRFQEKDESLRGELYDERQKLGKAMKNMINDAQLLLF